MRLGIAIGFFLSLPLASFGQDFDDAVYRENLAVIDSLYSAEAYPALEKQLNKQVAYLIETARFDSLHDYVYKSGRARVQSGKTNEGIQEAMRLVNIIEKEDPDTSRILFAINELSWVCYEAGKDSLCLETDLHFLDLCNAYANATPEERSDAHYNLGFDYQVVGNTPKSNFHFEEALKIVETDSINLLSQRMDCYNALGAGYWRNGELNKAKKALRKSNDLSLSMKDTVMAKLFASNAIGNLSLIYEDEANLAKSMELLEKAIDLRKAALPHLEEAYDRDIQQKHLIANYHNLAALYLSIGDIDRALAMTEYVYALQNDYFPDDQAKFIGYEESVGSIQLAAGNYKVAEKHLLKSLEATIKEYGEINYHTLNRHYRLARLYEEWGNQEKAMFHVNRTIELAKSVSDGTSGQELTKAYRLRASLSMESGGFAAARRDLNLALAGLSENFGEDGNPIAEILLDQSYLYLKEGKRDSAELCLDSALGIFQSNRSRNQTNESGYYSGIVRGLPEALLVKARFTNESDEASLTMAVEYLEEAIAYLQEERRNFDSDGAQLSFIDDHADIYTEAAGMAFERFQISGEEALRSEILRYAEERKAVLLKRQLNAFSSLRVAEVPDSVIALEHNLLKKLSDPDLKGSYGELEEEYDALIAHIRYTYPDYYELRYAARTATITDIQKELLGKEETLIEYVRLPDAMLAFVVTRDHVETVALRSNGLKDKIDDFNRAIIERDNAETKNLGIILHRELVKPLEKYFGGTTLFIVPDGPLYALNFEALTDESKGQYLIEEYTLSYWLSATTSLLYHDLDSDNDLSGALALAPGFENGENQTGSGEKFIRQPFAMKTAKTVGDLFSGQSLLAGQASEERFKNEAAKHRIIHLGTHTEINVKSPMLSRLILSRSDREDGYLHAYEIYNLPLRAELAVLTACETGVGKESQSEGVLSMAHGFAYAGCPSLVMSLWQIDEKTSAGIVESFYENLAKGMEKNHALRQSKLSYLKNAEGELKNPYYWSGLVLFGNTKPIESSSQILWIGLSLLGIAFLLFLANKIRRKRA